MGWKHIDTCILSSSYSAEGLNWQPPAKASGSAPRVPQRVQTPWGRGCHKGWLRAVCSAVFCVTCLLVEVTCERQWGWGSWGGNFVGQSGMIVPQLTNWSIQREVDQLQQHRNKALRTINQEGWEFWYRYKKVCATIACLWVSCETKSVLQRFCPEQFVCEQAMSSLTSRCCFYLYQGYPLPYHTRGMCSFTLPGPPSVRRHPCMSYCCCQPP